MLLFQMGQLTSPIILKWQSRASLKHFLCWKLKHIYYWHLRFSSTYSSLQIFLKKIYFWRNLSSFTSNSQIMLSRGVSEKVRALEKCDNQRIKHMQSTNQQLVRMEKETKEPDACSNKNYPLWLIVAKNTEKWLLTWDSRFVDTHSARKEP